MRTPPAHERSRPFALAIGALGVLVATLVACGSGDASGSGGDVDPDAAQAKPVQPGAVDPATEARIAEKPWEVVSKKGETYLTNVFYADDSENEQVMPLAVGGHVQIDRLVYPTVGNPNLFTKGDANDELVAVLRIEDAAIDFLAPKTAPLPNSTLSNVHLTAPTEGDGIFFYLVPRSARDGASANANALTAGPIPPGVVAIQPTAILQNPMPPDMPKRLATRRTLRFVFDQTAMQGVPAGLYDLRFEVKKGGVLHDPRGTGKGVYEYQYNAVRVFDAEPDAYDVVNVTDTQVSIGSTYDDYTQRELEQLVDHLGTTKDPKITGAAFMTFNGDLHNGGSPGSIRERTVAGTYAAEAKVVIDALARLPMPVFLTAGNHDGYVSMGQVPSVVKATDAAVSDSLQKVIADAGPGTWPGFTWDAFSAYLDATSAAGAFGGFHRDIFVGAFARNPKLDGFAGWKEVPQAQRNIVLYDGFHQWQKTYGPLTSSWRFGKNRYVSMNSYELRQHRRSGWGMYTVNYGGGTSAAQLDWLDRELLRAKQEASDVVVLAHHDPRGGHKGEDHGYYFEQLEYKGVSQSAINYLTQKLWNPSVCAAPDWAISSSQAEACLHDGLQEWMRPDEELDCAAEERIPTESGQDICEKALFDPALGARAHAYFWSGLELIKRLAASPNVRTLLLGHTHYNELEILQSGDLLVPDAPPIAGGSLAEAQMAFREIQNPVRGFAVMQESVGMRPDYDPNAVPFAEVRARSKAMAALLAVALPRTQHVLDAPATGPRELVVLRTVSNADLANQTYQGKSALGYAVLHVKAGTTSTPRIGGATFVVNDGKGSFGVAAEVAFDRTAKVAPRSPENPVAKVFAY